MTDSSSLPPVLLRFSNSASIVAILTGSLTLSGLASGQQAAQQPDSTPPAAATVYVRKQKDSGRASQPARAASRVNRSDMEERLPRSAPDALRYEPGVYVQQTAHGQGSAYIRGLTGQQTVLLFDGIRLNTSTYRQGPNQYFFTIDSQTLHSIEVIRGGSSTLFGSDAMGGVLSARPLEPTLDLTTNKPLIRPRTIVRYASADREFGERFQVDMQASQKLRFLGGVGYRIVHELESAGPVRSPTTGQPAMVPSFEADGRTQVGTGFRELTADGRLVWELAPQKRLTAAAYVYRQYDAPRTDQCPPPYASITECLKYNEQFRTLAYVAFDGNLGPAANTARVALSFQRQHERRTRERPRSFVNNGGIDDVNTLGVMAKLETDSFPILHDVTGKIRYGGDVYSDTVASEGWTEFTDVKIVIKDSRGQYAGGSRYTQGGVFAQAEAAIAERVTARAGVRTGAAVARSPSDPESGSQGVDRTWPVVVGHGGLEVDALPWLKLLGNVDRSFRAPNLDDLTSRQQTGPGFQFENPLLKAETSTMVEGGLRATASWLQADAWAFKTDIHDAITRVSKSINECPPSTPQCAASWSRFQLVNVAGTSRIYGLELAARAWLPFGFVARGTLAYTRGDGPNPQERPSNPNLAYESRVPLSRIPPMNGTFELKWNAPKGFYAGGALRWAAAQTRLSISDRSDARIPEGGTPGFAVVDFRTGYRSGRDFAVALVLENLGDTPYRYHGSSVNGPGRSAIVVFEAGL